MALCAMSKSRNLRAGCRLEFGTRQAKTNCALVRLSPSLSLVLVKRDVQNGGGVSRPR